MRMFELLGLIVPYRVRASYGPTRQKILRPFRESPSASARGAPQAATRGLGTAGIWASVVPLCGYSFTMGFRRIGQDHGDCDRGSPDLCETTATPHHPHELRL